MSGETGAPGNYPRVLEGGRQRERERASERESEREREMNIFINRRLVGADRLSFMCLLFPLNTATILVRIRQASEIDNGC